jgi:flagellum-specific peptidoglycan hydrolase FlgJ
MEQQKIFNIIFSFVSIVVIYFLIEISKKEETTFQFVTIYEYDNNDSLTIENIEKEIKKQKILFPDIVLRQAILETGYLKCKDCSLDNNNIFGFRYKNEYLKFDYWQQSVQYYKWWQSKKYKEGDYYKFLDNYYAEDVNYIKKLKIIKNESI